MSLKKSGSMILAVVMLIGLSIIPVKAAETSGSASVGFLSDYMWRGEQLSSGFVVQPTVGITYGSFGANLWANYDSDSKDHGELTETDLTLNYTFSMDKLSFDTGYIYYGLAGVDTAGADIADTQEIYLAVGYDTLLSPSLTVYYDIEKGNGAFIVASAGHSVEVSEGIDLNLGASVSYNANSKYSVGDYSAFHNGEVSASVSIPAAKSITIEPVVAYSFPLSDDAKTAISSKLYGGINVSLSF